MKIKVHDDLILEEPEAILQYLNQTEFWDATFKDENNSILDNYEIALKFPELFNQPRYEIYRCWYE